MTDEQLKHLMYALFRALHRTHDDALKMVREAMDADVRTVVPTPPTP